MKKSIWIDTEKKINLRQAKLDKINDVDILIIGGGIAGASTFFELRHDKRKILLIDSDKIGHGISSKTTGKLTPMQGIIYSKLDKVHGGKVARDYFKSQLEAIKIVRRNVARFKIDCDYVKTDSYIYIDDNKYWKDFQREYNFYKNNQFNISEVKDIPTNLKFKRAIKTTYGSVFHPINYIRKIVEIGIRNNHEVKENLRAIKLNKVGENYEVITTDGIIKAKWVVVTTHYPFFLNPGFIPFKSHIEHSYLLSSKVDNSKDFQIIKTHNPVRSIRYQSGLNNNYILMAGESIAASDSFDHQLHLDNLEQFFKNNFSHPIDNSWFTHDIMTNDGLPFIGKINNKYPNLLVATGFNKWGMTNGIISGNILKDILCDNYNPYIYLFNPSRGLKIKSLEQNLIDGYRASISYIKSYKKRFSFYPYNVSITYENGIRIGNYMDKNSKIHKVNTLCPHMKCHLVFNSVDVTWDCPCHGSRFDIDGNVIEGPSTTDIKILKR